jgi:hypothetical protein
MANANHRKLGEGVHHKRSGAGAMTEVPGNKIGDNEVLSNRDKSRRPDSQGLDGREIQNEQLQDQVHNQQSGERQGFTSSPRQRARHRLWLRHLRGGNHG